MNENQRTLDKTVLGLFQGHASTFLTTLYCSLKFSWDEGIPTACTNGIFLKINPTWFSTLSEKMRVTLLAHELWHVAYMHMARVGERDSKIWNMATDYAINRMLVLAGFYFDNNPTTGGLIGLHSDAYDGMSAEQIYEKLIEDATEIELPFGEDFTAEENQEKLSPADLAQVMANVVRANTASQMNAQEAGRLPGDFTEMLAGLLNPKLPWESMLRRWLTERSEVGYNWRKPNRRYQDMYLPSRGGEEGLAHLLWALDVSGSVTLNQLKIFNSELRGAKEAYSPERMTVVTFDTEIQNQWEFTGGDEIEGLTITGRGGTNMEEVFAIARKLRPSAMVIFSDMFCVIPEEIPGIPVVWLCYDNSSWSPPYGDVIHVDSTSTHAA